MPSFVGDVDLMISFEIFECVADLFCRFADDLLFKPLDFRLFGVGARRLAFLELKGNEQFI